MPEVEQFALRLEDSHWNYGECDNDVVIVYSAGDNVVSYLSWYSATQFDEIPQLVSRLSAKQCIVSFLS